VTAACTSSPFSAWIAGIGLVTGYGWGTKHLWDGVVLASIAWVSRLGTPHIAAGALVAAGAGVAAAGFALSALHFAT
jgi:hypothetical protein